MVKRDRGFEMNRKVTEIVTKKMPEKRETYTRRNGTEKKIMLRLFSLVFHSLFSLPGKKQRNPFCRLKFQSHLQNPLMGISCNFILLIGGYPVSLIYYQLKKVLGFCSVVDCILASWQCLRTGRSIQGHTFCLLIILDK